MLSKNLISEYHNNGVVVLRNIISPYWIEQLSIGIKKNFENPSQYKCVYEKKILRNYSLMITVIGKE